MRNWLHRIKRLFRNAEQRKTAFGRAAARFIEENPGSFVLLADPDTDVMIGAYKNSFVPIRMVQADGTRLHIVANALAYSKKDGVKNVDQFLLCVDSMLVNIAKMNDTKRRADLHEIPMDFVIGESEKTPEGIKSPLQPAPLK